MDANSREGVAYMIVQMVLLTAAGVSGAKILLYASVIFGGVMIVNLVRGELALRRRRDRP